MKSRMLRRRFLHSAVTVGAGLTILPAGLARGYAANEKLNVALVGVGGRGKWFVDTIPRMEHVVAVCDVNDEKIAEAFRSTGRSSAAATPTRRSDWERRTAAEFQRLGKEPAQDLPRLPQDARRDGRPDRRGRRRHARPHPRGGLGGGHAGRQARVLREAADPHASTSRARCASWPASTSVATSMGNQGTYSGPFRRAVELIRSGTIGDDQGSPRLEQRRRRGPPGTARGRASPCPPHLDWDLWLGPAAERPYHREWLQRHSVARVRHLPVGQLGLAQRQPGLHGPEGPRAVARRHARATLRVRVEAKSSGINRLSFPRWENRHVGRFPRGPNFRRSRSPGTTATPRASRIC